MIGVGGGGVSMCLYFIHNIICRREDFTLINKISTACNMILQASWIEKYRNASAVVFLNFIFSSRSFLSYSSRYILVLGIKSINK